jgi:hypothetical protein
LGHGEEKSFIVVHDGNTGADPVGGASISEVDGVLLDILQRVHLEISAFTYWLGRAGREIEGVLGVAALKTVCANTTLTVF